MCLYQPKKEILTPQKHWGPPLAPKAETLDMSSNQLGEMFEGDSADTCSGKNFHQCRWGAEWRVSRARARAKKEILTPQKHWGSPLAPEEGVFIFF